MCEEQKSSCAPSLLLIGCFFFLGLSASCLDVTRFANAHAEAEAVKEQKRRVEEGEDVGGGGHALRRGGAERDVGVGEEMQGEGGERVMSEAPLTLVTAVSKDFFERLENLIGSVHSTEPDLPIVVLINIYIYIYIYKYIYICMYIYDRLENLIGGVHSTETDLLIVVLYFTISRALLLLSACVLTLMHS